MSKLWVLCKSATYLAYNCCVLLLLPCTSGGACGPYPECVQAFRSHLAVPNMVKYLTWAVTQAPRLTERVILYQPIERPNATRITLTSNAAVKEISNSDAFYSQFGNSFEAIKVKCQYLTVWANNCLLTLFIQTEDNAYCCQQCSVVATVPLHGPSMQLF